MVISSSNISHYRSPNDVNIIVELLIDDFFESLELKAGTKETLLIKKLKTMKIKISPQLKNILEAPLDKIHFKDLINQLIIPVIHDHIEKAYTNKILTKEEVELMNIVISDNK